MGFFNQLPARYILVIVFVKFYCLWMWLWWIILCILLVMKLVHVSNEPNWQGGVCLAFADEVLCWLYGTVKESEFLNFPPFPCFGWAVDRRLHIIIWTYGNCIFGKTFVTPMKWSILIDNVLFLHVWLQMKITYCSLLLLSSVWSFYKLNLAQRQSLTM